MAIARRSPSVLLRSSFPAGSQWPKSAAGQPGFFPTMSLRVKRGDFALPDEFSASSVGAGSGSVGEVGTNSPRNFGETNDESNANAGSPTRQHATGMRGIRMVLNFVVPSVG